MMDDFYIFILMLTPVAAVIFFAYVASIFGKTNFSIPQSSVPIPVIKSIEYFDSFRLKNRRRFLCAAHLSALSSGQLCSIKNKKCTECDKKLAVV
jgi:hypothetical protein